MLVFSMFKTVELLCYSYIANIGNFIDTSKRFSTFLSNRVEVKINRDFGLGCWTKLNLANRNANECKNVHKRKGNHSDMAAQSSTELGLLLMLQ